MKILFVRPKPSAYTIGLQHLMIVEPLELEILATLVKDRHEVKIVDMILENEKPEIVLKKENPDVLGLTGYITHIPVMIAYCQMAKQINNKIKTVVGGVHIEKFPEDIDHVSVDYRVVRNATRTFPQLIAFLDGSGEFPTGVLQMHQRLSDIVLPVYDFFVPIPDRSLTKKYRHQYFYVFHNKVALLKTSFGCPFQCKFCFCREITGGLFYERLMDEVIAELKSIEEQEIYIVDDDFLLNPRRLTLFIDRMKEEGLKKRFLVYGRADFIVAHPDLIRLFKQAGLRTVIVGLESFANEELDRYNKKTTESINHQAMNILNENQVDCYAAVIVSPDWSAADFKRAGEIMNRLKIKFVNLQPLTPLKGTQMNCTDEQLIINRDDFARWDLAHVVIRPEKMSVREYYRQIIRLYEKVVFNPRNLISHIKYPLLMQLKMLKGLVRVRKQYLTRMKEASHEA
jgi:hopanoid C-3 methylase